MIASKTAVEQFSNWHEENISTLARHYRKLIPTSKPQHAEQYAFEVNLDQCTGCKACVVACHSLNGLDESESWRDVGLLLGSADLPYQQTITTACHHCAEPACSNGCPVLAYEKDPLTGIVRHLDDQCMGCSYCILKCPYDVPKFNKKRGIVRKCDMCAGRLSAGEAPACVQGCPNEAIAIKVVSVTGASANPLVPGVVDSSYTLPQTRYVSHSPVPPQSQPADADLLRVEATHMPLVLMLTLTQLSAGAWLAALGPAPTWLVWSAFFLSAAGVLASVAHLGQPLKAWRAFLGWRRSWLSREILLFGGFLATGFAAALGVFPASVVAALGVLSVFCSVMVYVDTRRPFWGFWPTFGKFFGTAIISYFLLENSLAGGALLLLKVAAEGLFLCTRSKSARILRGPLRVVTAARFAAAFLALLALPFAPLLALLLFALGEFCERIGFFRAVVAFKMPGVC